MLSEIEASIPALRRYARALLRSQQDADDLVHECLVRALDKLHTRRDGGDMRAWLFAILHNVFLSQTRHSQRHSTKEREATADISVEPGQEATLVSGTLFENSTIFRTNSGRSCCSYPWRTSPTQKPRACSVSLLEQSCPASREGGSDLVRFPGANREIL